MASETWGIVLAAGTGSRFHGPKQFAEVRGVRLVDRVVHMMTSVCDETVLVLPPNCEWDGLEVAAVVAGGSTRSQSVRAGLRVVPASADVVVIHDPAHPLADASLARRVIEAVGAGADGAVPGLPLDEPIKRVTQGNVVSQTIPRDQVWLIQTPQAFRARTLRDAHRGDPEIAEDSELLEQRGDRVVVVPGDARNIHVTRAAHLDLVAVLAGDDWDDSRRSGS